MGIITSEEMHIARRCMELAAKYGAKASRVSLSKSIMDSVSVLNGELDKVTHSADRSVYIYLFVDGRFGTFSTNRLVEEELEPFIAKAVDTVRMLAVDNCRQLPARERLADDARNGNELGLDDADYEKLTAEDRIGMAMESSKWSKMKSEETDYCVISEECEYSDGIDDIYLVDSQGFEGHHTETSYSVCAEVTVSDGAGVRYSGYEFVVSPTLAKFEGGCCALTALQKALRQRNPKKSRGGKRRMVVDASVASRLVSPLFSALNSSSIQQKNSFLMDALGKKLFSENLTIMDMAHTPGKCGSRLFDTEGVATAERPIIEKGVVKINYTSTYMSNKMGIEATCEGVSRPVLMPCLSDKSSYSLKSGENGVLLKDILSACRNGVYVTGFNGGNCNPVTGDFSYGVEGFAFRDGKICHPVREMLITGNMIDLWNKLMAAGTDYKDGVRWQIPSLAFEAVDFSA